MIFSLLYRLYLYLFAHKNIYTIYLFNKDTNEHIPLITRSYYDEKVKLYEFTQIIEICNNPNLFVFFSDYTGLIILNDKTGDDETIILFQKIFN